MASFNFCRNVEMLPCGAKVATSELGRCDVAAELHRRNPGAAALAAAAARADALLAVKLKATGKAPPQPTSLVQAVAEAEVTEHMSTRQRTDLQSKP
jgi:hypothetical protein